MEGPEYAPHDFNPRSPCGERLQHEGHRNRKADFNPRSPCGERLIFPNAIPRCKGISIHAPHAGSDSGTSPWCLSGTDFNPRSPCGERLTNSKATYDGFDISIHAPHAGSDPDGHITGPGAAISIHAPHAGSDVSTKSLDSSDVPDFNPRSPCGERHSISTPIFWV